MILLRQIAAYFFGGATAVLMLLAIFSGGAYFRSLIDFEGAKKGVSASIRLFIPAAFTASCWLYLSNHVDWLNAIFVFSCLVGMLLFWYTIQYIQFRLFEKTGFRKRFEDAGNLTLEFERQK